MRRVDMTLIVAVRCNKTARRPPPAAAMATDARPAVACAADAVFARVVGPAERRVPEIYFDSND
jgi:hypothetical protein